MQKVLSSLKHDGVVYPKGDLVADELLGNDENIQLLQREGVVEEYVEEKAQVHNAPEPEQVAAVAPPQPVAPPAPQTPVAPPAPTEDL